MNWIETYKDGIYDKEHLQVPTKDGRYVVSFDGRSWAEAFWQENKFKDVQGNSYQMPRYWAIVTPPNKT